MSENENKNDELEFSINDYARADIRIVPVTNSQRSTSNTVFQINRFLRDPVSNYIEISNEMERLYKSNGIVSRLITYVYSMLTYNYNIYPQISESNQFTLPDTKEEYFAVSEFIDKYDIKKNAPEFVKQTLINGMSFFYEMSDNDGVEYFPFPITMCKIVGRENGVYRFGIDVSQLDAETVNAEGFPDEIRQAYESAGNIADDDPDWIDGTYYIVGENGVAFTFDQSVLNNGGIGLPEFMYLLADVQLIEDAKENVDTKDTIDATRLIHGKIPMDDQGGVKMNPKTAQNWNRVINASLPEGIGSIVSPLELTSLNVSNNSNARAFDTLEDAQQQLFYSTGVSSTLFGREAKTDKILSLVLEKDASWLYNTVLPLLTAYYNSILNRMSTDSGTTWKIKFIRQNIFSKTETVDEYKDAVTLGGSRTDYLASLGMIPSEIFSKLNMEQNQLNIDELMKPKPTSYTMSGVETNTNINEQSGTNIPDDEVEDDTNEDVSEDEQP